MSERRNQMKQSQNPAEERKNPEASTPGRSRRYHASGSTYLQSKYGDFEFDMSPRKARSPSKATTSQLAGTISNSKAAARSQDALRTTPVNTRRATQRVPSRSSTASKDSTTAESRGIADDSDKKSTPAEDLLPWLRPQVLESQKRPTLEEFRQLQKASLVRVNNLLRLPQARRWVACEFFYSEIDRALLLGESDFGQCLREILPTLKARLLNRTEWRTIRKLIGKPRRCSAAFLQEERFALEDKRNAIRSVYRGITTHIERNDLDMPARVPHPLAVGDKCFACIKTPKDGIFAGSIDAVIDESYRVTFVRTDIPPQIVRDTDIMVENRFDFVPMTFFIKRNRAIQAGQFYKTPGYTAPGCEPSYGSFPMAMQFDSPNLGLSAPMSNDPPLNRIGEFSHHREEQNDSKVGNHSVKLLFAVVRLNKLIKKKRALVEQLQDMNSEAERISIFSDQFPAQFQSCYAEVVVGLESLNKQIDQQLNVLSLHSLDGLSSEAGLSVNPDALQKLSKPYAASMVKHCNVVSSTTGDTVVKSGRALNLITSLVALLLQVKTLGQSSEPSGSAPRSSVAPAEANALQSSIRDIKASLFPSSISIFEDNVEVHLAHIHQNFCTGLESDIISSILNG